MTAFAESHSRAGRVPGALRVATAAVALLIVGRLLLTSGDDEPITWNDVAASLAFTAIALAIALGAVLPRVERTSASTAAGAALGLAVLALLALPMFWFSGAPFALGACAFLVARASGAPGAKRTAAMLLGGFVAAVSLLIALAVTISQFDPTLPA